MSQAAAGHPPAEKARFRAALPVRWSDCDPAGIIYYANYYSFQEAGVIEYLRSRGTSWRELSQRYDVHFPRLESHCRYFASATYEDIVEVELHVPELARKVVTMAFRMFRQADQELLCEGSVKFAMAPFKAPEGEKVRAMILPDDVREIFGSLG